MNTLLSALLPVRNAERWITNSLRTISTQLLPQDEIIIVDDGSSDRTREFIQSFSFACQVQIFHTPPRGLVSALNLGIEKARNPWIARFDVDDEYPLTRVQLQRVALNEEISALFTDYEFIAEDGSALGFIPSAITSYSVALSLLNSQRTAHPSVIFNREKSISVGGYRQEDFPAEDLGLWFRLQEVGNVQSVPINLLRYRIRKGSITSELGQLARNRKVELLHSRSGQLNKIVREAFGAIEETIDNYSAHSFASHRSVLFLNDFQGSFARPHLSSSQRKRVQSLLLKELLSLDGLAAGITMQWDRLRRRRYRASIN